MHGSMTDAELERCVGCGSRENLGLGVYYYGKQLSVQERMEGSCCRTKQTTTAYEIVGRGSDPVCPRCVALRRLRHAAWIVPVLAMGGFALAFPQWIPPHGPLRLAFFGTMALLLFPAWIWGRRAVYPADLLRDEVAAARARKRMRGKAEYERENRGVIQGGLGTDREWSCSTPMRDYVFFTRAQYRRMGGADRPSKK
ncbi:hypothetical protein SAMN02745704_01487 [Paucidesulfovibrio gracilis DSM 16080]|uniref:Uncharacterized protein n=2 Tax=Paucidesulfovibrio TaxID=2910985 RepID=A0A1T4WXN9_9BACT|nr:hypothetical protein SAMN02745704_01487 [Paucidesulfovibrio gracilis DSM 16080]